MVMNHEIIIFTPIFALFIGFIVLRILKKIPKKIQTIKYSFREFLSSKI